MSQLTDEQIEALNEFSRTHPHLAKTFGYTSSDSNEGLGTALNSAGASNEITDGDSLGGDADVFEGKSGTTLRFRSISGGTGIEVTENPNDISIAVDGTIATKDDIASGFYGVTVAQSDDEASFRNINTIKFESSSFYVTQNDPNTDEVQVNFRGSAGGGGVSDHGDLTGLADDDHAQYILADGTRAFTGDQSLGGNKITNLGAPVNPNDAARLQDVGVTDHGALTGLGDDDHTQYVLADGTRNITDDFEMEQHVRVGDTLNVENTVTAEAFYLASGGEYSSEAVFVPNEIDLGRSSDRWREFFSSIHNNVFISSTNVGSASINTGAGNNRGNVQGFVQLTSNTATTGTITASGSGSNAIGSLASTGSGQHTLSLTASGVGSFVLGDVGASGGTGRTATVRATNIGSIAIGKALGSSANGTLEATNINSMALGYAFSGTITSSGGSSFAGGRAASSGSIVSSSLASFAFGIASSSSIIRATADGATAHGSSVSGSTIEATGIGSFAVGSANFSGNISASGTGSVAFGDSFLGTISASGAGSLALGSAVTGTIAATATGAVQIGVGTNAVANSIQLGSDFRATPTGYGNTKKDLTLGTGVTTFAVTSSVMEISATGLGNTISTITGGFSGQFLILLFTGSLITIMNNDTDATADSIDLQGAINFTGSDDAVLTLIHDGTKWREVSRSQN